MSEKPLVAVIDSGFPNTKENRKLWSGIDYRTIEHPKVKGQDYQDHGTMVANFAMRAIDHRGNKKRKIVGREFYRWLHIRVGDKNGQSSVERLQWAFQLCGTEGAEAINLSMGAWDHDYIKPEKLNKQFEPATRILAEVLKADCVLHAAAGNEDDRNYFGDRHNIPGGDADPDLDWPQADPRIARSANTFIWGSLRANGRASDFSGDGKDLFACMVGEGVRVQGSDGKSYRVSGTSFSSPKGLGLWLARRAVTRGSGPISPNEAASLSEIRMGMIQDAVHLPHSQDRPVHDDKHGWGSLEEQYQQLTRSARSTADLRIKSGQ